jgi:hypothetical protein
VLMSMRVSLNDQRQQRRGRHCRPICSILNSWRRLLRQSVRDALRPNRSYRAFARITVTLTYYSRLMLIAYPLPTDEFLRTRPTPFRTPFCGERLERCTDWDGAIFCRTCGVSSTLWWTTYGCCVIWEVGNVGCESFRIRT